MKSSFLASTALCAVLAPNAYAADLPTVKGPPPAPSMAATPFSWNGFYIGANLGGLWSQGNVTTNFDLGGSDALSPSGVLGGVQAGFNYQFSNVVIGVEGDLDWSSAKASNTGLFGISTISHSASLPFFGDVRVRAGYAFDRFLPYVTGGVVFADLHDGVSAPGFVPPLSLGRSNSTGWTIGGGAEYAIDNHWSVKAEYLYMQFASQTQTYVNGAAYSFKEKDSADVARLGLNYRF